ncbi:hypothetical protein HK101_009955 [Irineochytrium annulatum]|nr:hypothetical protein HK101_009955 [Irineochytrium annulatum]
MSSSANRPPQRKNTTTHVDDVLIRHPSLVSEWNGTEGFSTRGRSFISDEDEMEDGYEGHEGEHGGEVEEYVVGEEDVVGVVEGRTRERDERRRGKVANY